MTSARIERRLAAIMAADVVGYSALVERDESRTLAAIRALRSRTLEPLVAGHKGRIVKMMGDGVIVEFASVVEAVTCAVALQQEVAAHQEDASPEDRIVLRIGISLGDVVVEGDDLLGDGVNIAARIEALADPGGVWITDTVRKQLAGKISLAFEDAGERTLKNIAQPIRVFRWAGAVTPSMRLLPPEKPSIAVLPFDNMSGQQEETYFSDGITEDIMTGLARFRSLFVVARNSSFAFRGRPVDPAEIGRRLGVSYLLEDSVRRAGDRVRITAQLIEATSGMHLWAERYDRNLDDIFAVQDEVSQTIVSTLVGRIEEARLQQSLRRPTTSLAAYDCLLRGLAHFRGYAADDNRKAYEMFERAASLDPRYALAHSYLAFVSIAMHGFASAPSEVLDSAFMKATHALELDPQESRCHRVLALIWLYRRDYDLAEYHYRKALDLNPNDADRRMDFGELLALRGRAEEALRFIESAMRLNPFHPTWYSFQLGITLYSLQRYEEAAQAFKRMPSPGYWTHARLAACYAQLGRMAEAHAAAAEALRKRPGFSTAEFLHRDILLERAEDRSDLSEALIKAGLPK
jgi:adenylate cyclase